MNESLWQTLSALDLIHSSRMWIQTILLRGKHSKTMQTGTVSRFWLCRRLWRLKINDNERFARPSTMVSFFLATSLINISIIQYFKFTWIVTDTTTIRTGIAWSQTGHSTSHVRPHGVCDWTLNTPKIRIVQKIWFSRRRNSNSNLLIYSKTPRNRSNWFRREW